MFHSMRHFLRPLNHITRYPMSTFPTKCVSIDRYRCVTVDLTKEEATSFTLDQNLIEKQLTEAETSWNEERVRAIWFKVPNKFSHLIPHLVANAFDYHHAKPGYVQMVKWIATDNVNNIPSYAYTNVGVGALVVDSLNNVLVVREKISPVKGMNWKYPGGFADKGEELYQTAERECLEETGVKAKFKTVLGFRHMHKFQFGSSDLYFICLLIADETQKEIKKCDREIAEAAWMTIEQVKPLLSKFNLAMLERYEDYVNHRIAMHHRNVDFVLGGQVSLYSVSKDIDK